jgi:tRNA 2-selenouridine synthase
MAINKVDIQEFLQLAASYPVIDVRSQGEFSHAHIPGAYSLPLFTDQERKVVGTTYKQVSREAAIKIGLDYFGVKMRHMVEEVEAFAKAKTILVHCWRGGMRSAAVAWLLDLYGYKVYTLIGGYKAYRHWTLEVLNTRHPFLVLGGYTGSGKTCVLEELKQKGARVVDLEGIAHHKGSAFGAIGEEKQPSQEMFENEVASEIFNLIKKDPELPIWLEDESQRIGSVNIPNNLWEHMRTSKVYFLSIDFDKRLDYLVSTYGTFNKGDLAGAITRIQKRLGGLETKTALSFLVEDNMHECFRILLRYYDKQYQKGLNNRDNLESLLTVIPSERVDGESNARMVMEQRKLMGFANG